MLKFYEMVHAPSFFTTLHVHTSTPTTSTNNLFCFSQFSFLYFTSLLDHKTIPTISNNSLFLCTSYTPLFLHTAIPTINTKSPFLYISHSASSSCVKGPMSEGVLFQSLPASPKHGQDEQSSQSLIPYRWNSEKRCFASCRQRRRCLGSE